MLRARPRPISDMEKIPMLKRNRKSILAIAGPAFAAALVFLAVDYTLAALWDLYYPMWDIQ